MSKKKYHSPEFKQEAVRLAEDYGNKSPVAYEEQWKKSTAEAT